MKRAVQHSGSYRNVICACCFFAVFVNIGIASTTFNVFLPYINELPGMSDSWGSVVSTLRTLASLAAMFCIKRYYQALDCRLGVSLACLCSAAAFLLYSLGLSLPCFLMGSILAGFAYGIGGMVAATLLIDRWFNENRASALGVASAGSGIAAVIMPMINTYLVESFSLRIGLLFQSVLCVLIALLLFIFLQNRPFDSEDKPSLCSSMEELNNDEANAGGAAKKRLRDCLGVSPKAFAILICCLFMLGIPNVGANSFYGSLLRSSGYGAYFTGLLLIICGVALMLGKLSSGFICDKLGQRRGFILFYLLLISGSLLSCLVPLGSGIIAGLAALLIYPGLALGNIGTALLALNYSDEKNREQVLSAFQVIFSLGCLLGNSFPGFMMDAWASYALAYAVYALCSVLSLLCMLRLEMPKDIQTRNS